MADRDVAVIGTGQTVFGTHPDTSLAALYLQAVDSAVDDGGIGIDDIDSIHYGNHVGGRDYDGEDGGTYGARTNLAAEIADHYGEPVQVKRHEAACASSAAAFESAYRDVARGDADIAVAGGSEQLASVTLPDATDALATATAADMNFPQVFAALTEDYADVYDLPLSLVLEGMAHIGQKNRAFGTHHAPAQYQGAFDDVTVEDAADSPVMDTEPINAPPLRLYDCCANADGGSAVILADADTAETLADTPVYVTAAAQRSGRTYASHGKDTVREGFTTSRRAAAEAAYDQAGIDDPRAAIDVAEVHDCFTIDEIKAIEDLGFVAHGQGWAAAWDGLTREDGVLPVNPSGGLIANGHPVGATGTRQVASAVGILRGDDTYDYLDIDADTALTDTMGGDLGTSVVTILSTAP